MRKLIISAIVLAMIFSTGCAAKKPMKNTKSDTNTKQGGSEQQGSDKQQGAGKSQAAPKNPNKERTLKAVNTNQSTKTKLNAEVKLHKDAITVKNLSNDYWLTAMVTVNDEYKKQILYLKGGQATTIPFGDFANSLGEKLSSDKKVESVTVRSLNQSTTFK